MQSYLWIRTGEAIEKMLQEKKFSSKINYEVLKSLNVSVNTSSKEQQKPEEPVLLSKVEVEEDNSSSLKTLVLYEYIFSYKYHRLCF